MTVGGGGGKQSLGGEERSRELPASLKTPINITFGQMIAHMLINNGVQECDLSDHLRIEWLILKRDILQLIIDAAKSVDFDLDSLELHLLLDARPLLHLFACKFPRAFRFQLHGTPVKPRKNGGWNIKKKLELVDFVDQSKSFGLTETQACDWYAFLKGGHQPTVQSLITRYHEAKKWFEDSDSWTCFERFELIEYYYKIVIVS
jgi:hypothetical protein